MLNLYIKQMENKMYMFLEKTLVDSKSKSLIFLIKRYNKYGVLPASYFYQDNKARYKLLRFSQTCEL